MYVLEFDREICISVSYICTSTHRHIGFHIIYSIHHRSRILHAGAQIHMNTLAMLYRHTIIHRNNAYLDIFVTIFLHDHNKKNLTHTHSHTDLLCACTSVNEKMATMDTVIGHKELVCHTVHRHEPPVSAQPLIIIHNDDHLVVLDKPASIPVSQFFITCLSSPLFTHFLIFLLFTSLPPPITSLSPSPLPLPSTSSPSFPPPIPPYTYVMQVHPCGRYRHNSVVFLFGKEYNLKHLHIKSVAMFKKLMITQHLLAHSS